MAPRSRDRRPSDLAAQPANDAGNGFLDGERDIKETIQDPRSKQHRSNVAKLREHLRRKRQHQQQKPPEPRPQSQSQSQPSPSPTAKDREPFPLTLNIVIHVVGSRGDVQPFVALGQELRKHGHRVRLATHCAFRAFVRSHGLEFFNIGGDPEEMMAFMVRNPGLLPDFQTIRSGGLQHHRECVKVMVCGCWRACYQTGEGMGMAALDEEEEDGDDRARPFVADAIIANPPSFAHVHCAEKLGIPLNIMFTMPWTATQAFPHPLANVQRKSTNRSVANFVSYALVEMILWQGLGDIFNTFRKKELGLAPLDATRAPGFAHQLKIPYTYLWSPALLPKPDDWGDLVDICGFSFLPSKTDYTAPDDLAEFLAAGPPPVYIGFGSIVVDNPAGLTRAVLDAVRISGQRAIVSKGWGQLGGESVDIPDNVLLLGSVPHDWLFRRVSCVVHHGGAGTTATGLALGRPTIVVSFFGDQLFWGSIVARAGAGPRPIPYRELSADKLAAAIGTALDGATQRRAAEIGDQMQSECGVLNTANSFHHHLDLDRLRCAVVPSKPAVWRVKHSETALSAVAAAVLVEDGYLKPQSLVLYRPEEYDSDRDPRGPLSAGAEVLLGAITTFITGFGVLPFEMLQVFTTTRTMARRQACESCNNRQPEGESHHKPDGEPHHQPNGEPVNGGNQNQSSPVNSSTTQSTDPDAFETEDQLRSLRLTGQETRRARQRLVSKPQLADTGAAMNRFAKRVLKAAILLPADFTVSLSRGFHNAPKLYHDRMVKATPRVVGVRSGFRAAGEEFVNGFYNGITGLVTQPYHEVHDRTGSAAVLKGIGKGLGGVILKPAAGVWGLAGYPLNGLHVNLRQSLSKNISKNIAASRYEQGTLEMEALSPEERERIVREWRALKGLGQDS
ncbi:glycosyltransferase family 1 protein [Aspergillus sp. HF37]|nr:glycosyltransferase family 1 protein [Aspergillus sp. HF37]